MDIILSHHRHVEIDHPRKLFDIETARSDIRGHEDMGFAGLEIAKSLGPRALAFVSVNRRSAQAGCGEVPAEAVATTLGAAENQSLIVALLQQMDQQSALSVVRNAMNTMAHGHGCAIWSRRL